MLKLTRLNNHVVAINPDHIGWADATPDTTLFLLGGEKIIVRQSIDELIELLIEFRRSIRAVDNADDPSEPIGDPPRISVRPHSVSTRPSLAPLSSRGTR